MALGRILMDVTMLTSELKCGPRFSNGDEVPAHHHQFTIKRTTLKCGSEAIFI